MKEMAPNIFQGKAYSGTEHMRSANLYLVHGHPRSLLIDAGYNNGETERLVFGMLESLSIAPERLDVFLTHNHPDHAGLAKLLSDRGSRIFLPAGERQTCAAICGYYANDRSVSLDRLHRYGFTQREAETILERAFQPDYHYHKYNWTDFPAAELTEGTALSYGPYTFQVVSLPGHTRYQVGLAEWDHKWLFVGDTISRNEVLILSATEPGGNLLARHLQTLDKLAADYADFWVVPGHANPFHGTGKAVENTRRYFAHIAKRIEETVVAAEKPLPLAAIFRQVFRYKPGKAAEEESLKLHFRISNTLVCLEWLVGEGRLAVTETDDGWLWSGAEK